MNSNNFQKGDILFSTHRDLRRGYHPIIYLQGYSEKEFIGGMITHSITNDNINLFNTHFEERDSLGNQYIVLSDNTFLVPTKLVKFESWGPFRKVGKLTEEGIEFVENAIGNFNEETFVHYYRRTRN